MPILSPEYISTWYYFLDANNSVRLFEKWTEAQTQSVENIHLLQGDVGVHVMNVGGIRYQTTIDSPVVIIENSFGTQVTNAFDLIKESFNVIRNPTLETSITYVMKKATISIAETGVGCHIEYMSGLPGAFHAEFGPSIDFIGRVARFYDTQLYISTWNLPQSYQVISGTIDIDVTVKENFFLGTGQTPYFSIQGYAVTGDLKVLAKPDDPYLNIAEQIPGTFSVMGYATTALQIGTAYLAIGESNMNTKIDRSMSAEEITTASISFNSFARYTTPIG